MVLVRGGVLVVVKKGVIEINLKLASAQVYSGGPLKIVHEGGERRHLASSLMHVFLLWSCLAMLSHKLHETRCGLILGAEVSCEAKPHRWVVEEEASGGDGRGSAGAAAQSGLP